jgi:hypothetical protein
VAKPLKECCLIRSAGVFGKQLLKPQTNFLGPSLTFCLWIYLIRPRRKERERAKEVWFWFRPLFSVSQQFLPLISQVLESRSHRTPRQMVAKGKYKEPGVVCKKEKKVRLWIFRHCPFCWYFCQRFCFWVGWFGCSATPCKLFLVFALNYEMIKLLYHLRQEKIANVLGT